ncbi:MAG: glycosyltransferase [Phycisphaerae bacterium]
MKVLMLGWEFPPFISGGLGTACYGLTRALSEIATEILFVLPRPVRPDRDTHVTLVAPRYDQIKPAAAPQPASVVTSAPHSELANVTIRTVDAQLSPYSTPGQSYVAAGAPAVAGGVATRLVYDVTEPGNTQPVRSAEVPIVAHVPLGAGPGPGEHYGGDLFSEVERYAALVGAIGRSESFEVVHAHDWMTFPAGMAVAAVSGRPLVVHVHSTEFDRSGEHVNQRIYDIERRGVHTADRVIAVSHLTKNILVSRYAVPPGKIEVVYNAIDDRSGVAEPPPIRKDERIVLFLGRITMQKGPEYFIAAAKRVLEYMDNVRFVMAGSGDMMRRMIELAAEMGIGHKVLFTGFLRGADVARVFKMADLYVMPSVSEPFGIAPLEALSHDVPVIISKQSGVSEVLSHCLKVDFWDVNEMANKIIAVLRHPPLQATLREHGQFEIRKLTWRDAAERCVQAYRDALAARAPAMR